MIDERRARTLRDRRLVGEVWNCVDVRCRINNLIAALWNEKKRRLGYEFF